MLADARQHLHVLGKPVVHKCTTCHSQEASHKRSRLLQTGHHLCTKVLAIVRQHLYILRDAVIHKTEVVQEISPQKIDIVHTCVARCARLLEANSHIKYPSLCSNVFRFDCSTVRPQHHIVITCTAGFSAGCRALVSTKMLR